MIINPRRMQTVLIGHRLMVDRNGFKYEKTLNAGQTISDSHRMADRWFKISMIETAIIYEKLMIRARNI